MLTDALVVIDSHSNGGTILELHLGPNCPEEAICSQIGLDPGDILRLQEGEILCPGFIDLHVHAPQYSYSGTATDKPLMTWLDAYAFPREKGHADSEAASQEYSKLARRLVSHGTTTALVFGTVYKEACQRLALCMRQQGMRGLVGKVCMDRNSPEDYTESTADSLADTEAFIHWVQQMKDDRIQAVVTPRFVPTCSPPLLEGLGDLAAKYAVPVQSHISESFDQVEFSEALHPGVRDAALFDTAGLLTPRAVMAHATCLTDSELSLLAARGAAVAHCPLSNFFFGDRIFHVRHALRLGVKVGLGTDVAGGYRPSMLSAMRNCVVASRALRMQLFATMTLAQQTATGCTPQLTPAAARQQTAPLPQQIGTEHDDGSAQVPAVHSSAEQQQGGHLASSASGSIGGQITLCSAESRKTADCELIDWKGAFWLATMGGAQALGLQDKCGSLEPGKAFDALLVNTRMTEAFDVFPADSPWDAFEKFLNIGDDRNIRAVWVAGKLVHGQALS